MGHRIWNFGTVQSRDLTRNRETGENLSATGYLDVQKRYRILESVPSNDAAGQEKQFRVLDCQPFQVSLLEALTKQEDSTSTEGESTVDPDIAPIFEPNSVKAVTLPPIAQPYLALHDKFSQALPIVHDAWQQNGQQILLLEDRSQFPLLIDLWLDEDLPLPQLQVLHWLYEMVELWNLLEPLNCHQSLLDTANLKVDEDQTICLQRLYTNLRDQPTLQDLGRFWQMLFTESQRTQLGALSLLLAELEAGKLTSPAELKTHIETIAYDLQANQPDTEMTPNPANDLGTLDLPINTP